MQYIATQKYTRQSPRKVRLVVNTIKDMKVDEAVQQLAVMNRKATIVVLKTLRQAIANATHNHQAQIGELTLKEITVNEGPRYRRFRAVSRGRAHGVIKRTCHVRIVLEDAKSNVSETKKQTKAKTKPAAPAEVAQPTAAETAKAAPKVSRKTGQVSAKTATRTARVSTAVKKAGNK